MVGKILQQYQFLEKLGAGGMGEIYKARDTRLNRFVAIKVLTSASAGDPERRRRFIQEAQAASALNHPNIITIHDIITADDADHLVMEYVQGKTLVDLIPKGGLRVPQVLKSGVQMTDALQAAHSAGIVHRDLKPGNVMVTDSGLVKILDFGLAKLTDAGPISQVNNTDVTQTIADAPLTVEGSIIGTVSYMSPEQAQGKKVDPRSDVFSLGVVLYEMVTGARAFAGESALSTLSSILRDEARPILEISPDVPPQLEQVIKRCLRKNPDDRFQTMREVQAALGALKHESDSGMLYRSRVGLDAQPSVTAKPAAKSTSAPMIAGLAVALGIVLAAGGGAWWWMKHRSVPTPPPAVAAVTTPTPTPVPPPVVETPPAPAPADQPLNNDSIVAMVQGKVANGVILSQIRTADKTSFNLSATEVIRLTKAGVPDEVIETMRNPKRTPARIAPAPPNSVATASPAPTPAPTPPPAPVPAATVASVASTPVVAAPATRPVTLEDGLPIRILLSDDVPDSADTGLPLRFTVADDLKMDGAVVIAKGAAVTGEIVEGSKKKFFGGGTKMTMRLLTIEAVDGHKYRVRATSARGGDGKNVRAVETNMKPKSKDLTASAGAQYIAYVDGDVTVSVRK